MTEPSTPWPDGVRGTVEELRGRLGLFSFRHDAAMAGSAGRDGGWAELGVRPGGIVECLVAGPGVGAATCTLQAMSRSAGDRGVCAFVDLAGECYPPALSGWGISPSRTLLIRPATRGEMCWADRAMPAMSGRGGHLGVDRPSVSLASPSPLATGGGSGRGCRACSSGRNRRAESRPGPTCDCWPRRGPVAGAKPDEFEIDVLYRRGGLGGTARVWEIDHAAGAVRLVPEVADPATEERTARA